jgi:two-component system KDP operon response regulator KdpE
MPHRILVVEDSPDLQKIFTRVLTNAGFEVMVASTNSEAMQVLQEFEPDLVLTDCFLPGAGPVIVSVLKESRPKLPVIVLSGDPEGARQLLPDADAVLGKPISLAELVHTVRHFMAAVEADRLSDGAVS